MTGEGNGSEDAFREKYEYLRASDPAMNQGPTSLSPLEPGAVLAGKYRIERIIGQGGMGIVAAAHHIQLEQRVALKLMLPHAMVSGEAVSRFLREARAAARISSEHVARVFDVGSLETGEPYIAMEYLEGTDISQLLSTRGRLASEEAIDYLLQACEALAEAHAAGIIHRDLKPGNLFLVHRVDGQRLVKVLDFGISKMTDPASQSNAPATRTSALMGSPLYMSPEQMGSSKAVDARSDVWALGVVFYEMLSGSSPFNGETLPQVCGMVMNEEPPPLAERAPGLPPLIYEVVSRCLQKQPAARFQSVAELAHALEPIASPRARQSVTRISHVQGLAPRASAAPQAPPTAQSPQHAAQVITGPPAQPHAGTYAPLSETTPPQVARRSAAPFVVFGLAALALAGVGLWLTQRSTSAAVAPDAAGSNAVVAAPPIAPIPVAPSAVTPPTPAAEPGAAPVGAADNAAPGQKPANNAAPPALGKPVAHTPPKSAQTSGAAPAAAVPVAAPPVSKPAPAPAAPAPASAAKPAAPVTTRSRL